MRQEEKFKIHTDTQGDICTVYLFGELDLAMAPGMRQAVEPFIGKTDKTLVLNLKGLDYIDSTGIGIIVSILKARDKIQAPFRVEETPAKIKRFFDVAGITQFIMPA